MFHRLSVVVCRGMSNSTEIGVLLVWSVSLWCPSVSTWCPSVSTRRHAMTRVEPVRWCRRHDCPQLVGSGNTRRKWLKLWHDQHGAIQHESFVVQVGTVWVGISHFDPNYVVDVFGTVCDVRC